MSRCFPTRDAVRSAWFVLYSFLATSAPCSVTFTLDTDNLLGGSPGAVLIANFAGDEISDVISGGTLLIGNGNGTYQAGININIAADATADFNGDQNADLATFTGEVTLRMGNGDGTFQAGQSYATGMDGVVGDTFMFIVADINADTLPDIVAANRSSSVSVLLNDGSGGLKPKQVTAVGSPIASVAAGDFNGDGKPDLAVTTTNASSQALGLLLGNGDGTFQPATQFPVNTGASYNLVVAADFTGDEKLDAAVLQWHAPPTGGGGGATGGCEGSCAPRYFGHAVVLLQGTGSGTFQPQENYLPRASYFPLSSKAMPALGDLNGDGRMDLVLAQGQGAAVLTGSATGFAEQPGLSLSGFDTGPTAIADVNRDYRPDIVVAARYLSGVAGTNKYAALVLLAAKGNAPLPSATLTVSIDPPDAGTVTGGFEGESARQLGTPYAIRAFPAAGFLFAGWSGANTSLERSITVTLASDESLVAHFIRNPFIDLKGTYSGLVTSLANEFGDGGLLTGTVNSTGFFSGRLQLGDERYVLSGPLTVAGALIASIEGADGGVIEVSLQLDVKDNSQQISGTIARDGAIGTVLANRAVFHAKTNPSELAGRYTVIFAPDAEDSGDAFPQGCGGATVRIKRDGSVRLVGRLGDGGLVSVGSFLGKTNTWPLFARPDGGGQILGLISHRDVPGISDLDGELRWTKPMRPADRFYPDGFEARSHLFGSVYIFDAPVIAVASSTPNLGVDVRGGNLAAPVAAFATLTTKNRIRIEPTPARIQLKIVPGSGLFQGKLVDPATNRVHSVFGGFVQKQHRGFGLVRGTSQTGAVALDRLE